MSERIVGIVKAYSVGNPDSIVVVIPKGVHEKLNKHPKGQKFLVKLDENGRIIYEPIQGVVSKSLVVNEGKKKNFE